MIRFTVNLLLLVGGLIAAVVIGAGAAFVFGLVTALVWMIFGG